MIEITHAQARHLIRAGQDGRRLPEEQWTALQAHLERCAECRAYRARIRGLEHSLTRLLRDRWRALEESDAAQEATAPTLLRYQRARAARSRSSRRALPYAVGLLAVLAFFVWRQAAASQRAASVWNSQPPASPPPTAAPTPLPGPSPTPGGGRFDHLLAFPALVDGRPDIFLLNPGAGAATSNNGQGERTNLTSHPARDIEPAWSPDGEWIAFLSDRAGATDADATEAGAGGKFELYVISVAGTRLTRLTSSPDIQWSGPLSWSPDGQYIALTGWRDLSAQHSPEDTEVLPPKGRAYVYLVPLDGSGPLRLALTRDVPGALRFSPGANLLAFTGPNDDGLLIYDLLSGRYTPLVPDPNAGDTSTLLEGKFDWSPDGRRLAYLVDPPGGQGGTALNVSTDLFRRPNSRYDASLNNVVYRSPENQPILSVSLLPDRARRVFALLIQQQPSCQVLHLLREVSQPRAVRGLCVEGALASEQWTRGPERDGEWLVVTARASEGAAAAGAGAADAGTAGGGVYYYAVRIPADLALNHPAPYQPLAPAEPTEDGAGFYRAVARPRAGGGEGLPPIDPRPAAPASLPPEPVIPHSASLPGRLAYTQMSSTGASMVMTSRPLGGDRAAVTGLRGFANCPAWSPDGGRLAFLSNHTSASGAMELFVLDGAAPRQLTNRASSHNPLASYDTCPVWSPDGARLAVIEQYSSGLELLLFSPEEADAPPSRLPIEDASSLTNLVWTPDGQGLLLADPSSETRPLRIFTIDLRGDAPRQRLLAEFIDLDDAYGLAISPPELQLRDHPGPWIAFVGVQYLAGQRARQTLYTMRLDGHQLQPVDDLPSPGFEGWVGDPGLAWLPDGSLVYPIRHIAHEKIKTSLWWFSPEGERRPLAYLEDLLIDSAWSADGRWLAYTSDMGLFLLDRQAALRGETAPILVSDAPVNELDWR